MRKRALFVACVVAVALLLTAVITQTPHSAALSSTPADYPAKGDTWTYNVTLFGMTGYATVKVMGTVNIKAGVNEEEEYHCYNFSETMEVKNETAYMSSVSNTYYTEDGSIVATYGWQISNYTISTPDGDMNLSIITKGYYYFDDTWKMFVFPLEEGKTWRKDLKAYFIGWTWSNYSGIVVNTSYDWANTTPGDFRVTGKVINVTMVKTVAGTFECWLINTTGGPVGTMSIPSYSLIWYSPEVKNFVYREDYIGGALVATWNLTSYSVSYPTHEMIQTLTLFTLWNMQQQQQQTNMMIMAGVGVAVAAVVVGVSMYLYYRRMW